jgi:hypothetical protein
VPDLVGWPRDKSDNLLRWGAATFDVLGPLNKQAVKSTPASLQMLRFAKRVVRERSVIEGSMAHELLIAADAGKRFDGGISLGFCPDLLIHKPFCRGEGGLTAHWQKHPPTWVFDKVDTVRARWRILQGEGDEVCDPKFAGEFAAGQRDSKAIMLPKVGHGFGVPKNWMPQYQQSLHDLLDAR